MKSKNVLIILLGASVLAGCSYTDMDCQSERNIAAAEQGFAAYVSGLVGDAEGLKTQAPGLQRLGNDKELGHLLEGFQVPSLKLHNAVEKSQQGMTARTCSGKLVATLQGVEKTYAVNYGIARSRPLGAPAIEFPDAGTATAAYRLVEDILMAARRAETLARYQQLSEKAQAAGFADVRLYEQQQSLQQQKLLLVGERERIARDLTRLQTQVEESKIDAATLKERLSRAEIAHKDFMRKLKSGRDFGVGTDNLQIQDLKLTLQGGERQPQLDMKVTNKGKQTLTSVSLEVRVYLDGSDQPFLVSGDRLRNGRFSLRFMEPGLQPGAAVDSQAGMTGKAEAWQASELRTAKRRQLVVRVLDTLSVDAEKVELSPYPEPSAELLAAQLRLKEAMATAATLVDKLKLTQAASGRLDGEIKRLETDLSALDDAARSGLGAKG